MDIIKTKDFVNLNTEQITQAVQEYVSRNTNRTVHKVTLRPSNGRGGPLVFATVELNDLPD